MRKNKTRNWNCYKGILHTFNANGCTIFHKRIYYRYVCDKDGNQKAKEILTGYEFPIAEGILLGQYTNVDNFVSGNTLVFDNEIFKYLSSILSDKTIFEKEIQEILFYETIDIPSKKRQRNM